MIKNSEELVSAFHKSNMSQEDFCKYRHISVSALKYHITKLKRQEKISTSGSPSSGNFIHLKPTKNKKSFRTLVLLQGEFDREDITYIFKSVTSR